MTNKLKNRVILKLLIATFIILGLQQTDIQAQEKTVVDEIIGVVGNHIILKSELEAQYLQYRSQVGLDGDEESIKCDIFEGMLFSKLLVHFGEVDSVKVSDLQVERTIDMRLGYFISQFGSIKAMEEYYGKSINDFKEEMSVMIKEQMISDGKKQEIIGNVTITPSEVKSFFKTIPSDSIPTISSEYEFGEITKTPVISETVKNAVKERITGLRERIIKGESFKTLAILYSEDPGSASKGGETGLTARGQWDPAFTTAAFKLKENEISEVVESQFGYHILQLIERKGDYINVRHILLMLKPSYEDIVKATTVLDSVANLIRIDSLTFEDAVVKYSDDEGRFTGGLMINTASGNSMFRIDELDRAISYELDKMQVGDISNPVPYKTKDGKDAYRILYLKSKSLPHKANLIEDYDQIQEWAQTKKNQKIIGEWVNEKAKVTFIRINKDYRSCEFKNKWF